MIRAGNHLRLLYALVCLAVPLGCAKPQRPQPGDTIIDANRESESIKADGLDALGRVDSAIRRLKQ